ncbi:MAG: cytochrome c peroxidase [Casimicrobiaceae bacterium]
MRSSAVALVIMLWSGVHGSQATELKEAIRPLPLDLKVDVRKAELGRRIFVEPRLARDTSVSCVSCHDFSRGGADPRPRSLGPGGAVGGANAPTVFNSALNFRQQWSGAVGSMEEFLDRLIKNPKVFDSNWPDVIARLRTDKALVAQFNSTYADGLTDHNIIDATATFVRTLVTPSRFDRYLRGDPNAIDPDERRGYEKFKAYGCVACHQGVNVGGNMFQKFGVMGDYFAQRGNITTADFGRFNVTNRERDKHVFKVPSLRNVELTAPYFHDASAATLEAAVDVMFKYQLGRTAPAEDKALIVKFLKTLTGEHQPTLAGLTADASGTAGKPQHASDAKAQQ